MVKYLEVCLNRTQGNSRNFEQTFFNILILTWQFDTHSFVLFSKKNKQTFKHLRTQHIWKMSKHVFSTLLWLEIRMKKIIFKATWPHLSCFPCSHHIIFMVHALIFTAKTFRNIFLLKLATNMVSIRVRKIFTRFLVSDCPKQPSL